MNENEYFWRLRVAAIDQDSARVYARRHQFTVGRPLDFDAEYDRLQHYSSDRIFLNPDCGFGTFSNRPMNSEAVAVEKLRVMTAAARALRG